MTSSAAVRIALALSGALVVAGCSSTISAGDASVSETGSGGAGRAAAAPLAAPAPVAPGAIPAAQAAPVTPAAAVQRSGFGPASAYPRPAVFRLPPVPRGKVVYLTFDDGPTPYTTQILDLLKKNNAKATFFVIGQQVAKRAPTVARAYREGHAVENHTWSHPTLTRLTWADFRSQIARTNVAVQKATGDAPECIRPPYGSYNKGTLIRAQRFGMPLVLWSIDSRDWARPGTGRIVKNVLNNVGDGSIVLMHDGGGPRAQTVAAVKYLLPELRKRGYAIRALPCN